jgi:hypothetical protein
MLDMVDHNGDVVPLPHGDFTYEELDFNGSEPSDVDDPQYVPASDIRDAATDPDAPENMMDRHRVDAIRTLSGMLDFLQNLDDSYDWQADHDPESLGHRRPAAKPKLDKVETVPLGGARVRADTFSIDKPERIVSERLDRTRLLITNRSAGTVYLSGFTGMQAGAQLGVYELGAGLTLEVRTQHEIWAASAVVGTPQVVSIWDEFGYAR